MEAMTSWLPSNARSDPIKQSIHPINQSIMIKIPFQNIAKLLNLAVERERNTLNFKHKLPACRLNR
jgi:hypothetical protein